MLSWVLCLSSIVFCLFSIVRYIIYISCSWLLLLCLYSAFLIRLCNLHLWSFVFPLSPQSVKSPCLFIFSHWVKFTCLSPELSILFYFLFCCIIPHALCFILVCLQVRFLLLERLLPCVIISAMKLLLCFMSGFPSPVFESNPVCHTMNWPSLIWNVYVENIIIFIILTLFIPCRY